MIIKLRFLLFLFATALLFGCTSAELEYQQQEPRMREIVKNQPVPNLHGWSFEREIAIQAMIARNNFIPTWTYLITDAGVITEICQSIGFPIPYATQITRPQASNGASVPEPTGLYPPSSAEGSYVTCVNPDGSMTTSYFEPRVFAMSYPIVPDRTLVKQDDSNGYAINVSPPDKKP